MGAGQLLKIERLLGCMFDSARGCFVVLILCSFVFLYRYSGEDHTLHVRSMLGLLPLLASIVLEGALIQRLPGFKKRLTQLLRDRPDIANQVFYIKIVIRAAAKINIINTACQWNFWA